MGIEKKLSDGKARTQVEDSRLFFSPNASAQGYGFWTSKYSPNGKNAALFDRPSDLQDLPVSAVHFDGNPDEEEETIKSELRLIPSAKLFSEAHLLLSKSKSANESVRPVRYTHIKYELERRSFLNTVNDAMKSLAHPVPSLAANRAKKTFELMHGIDDEDTSTSDKEDLTAATPVEKAIGTKPSDERERPQKKAKPNVTAKVSASKNGKKNYDYRESKGEASKEPGKPATPDKATVESASTPLPVDPQKLADILRIDLSRVKKLASVKDEAGFVSYFKAKGGAFLRKHRIPDSYLSEVFRVLNQSDTSSQ